MKLLAMLAFALALPSFAADVFIPADDAKLVYSDCFKVEFIDAGQGAKKARFSRPGQSYGRGYEADSPGARLRFRTDAPSLDVKLFFNELHVSKSARNSKGVYLVDGRLAPSFSFATKQTSIARQPEELDVAIASPGKGFHDYEVVMPYGDSVDVLGVGAPEGSKFEAPTPRPAKRCVFYGDSVTHGFTASSIAGTYPFAVSQLKGFQMVNLGIGGRSTSAKDGEMLASAKCDLAVVHIGVNNWQGGVAPEKTKADMAAFLKGFRALQPDAPLFLVTPLWVGDAWKPKGAKFPLEDYRKAMREAVAESGAQNVFVVEGETLIDHDVKLFDSVLVHPNDAGFAQMGERLAKAIK